MTPPRRVWPGFSSAKRWIFASSRASSCFTVSARRSIRSNVPGCCWWGGGGGCRWGRARQASHGLHGLHGYLEHVNHLGT
ncbi:hypothetical protein M9X92_008971 [Pyricularia oryzae]|nr:hypothetical protein M9X92_008971 [Pyricularia oryzae]